jgi:hypothetical protein
MLEERLTEMEDQMKNLKMILSQTTSTLSSIGLTNTKFAPTVSKSKGSIARETPPLTPEKIAAPKITCVSPPIQQPNDLTPTKLSPRATIEASFQAWGSFCALARHEMSEADLSLVSLEMLEAMMDHYGCTNEVLRARIEVAWTFLQPLADLKKPEFDLSPLSPTPRLSRRRCLESRMGACNSNPNDTISISTSVAVGIRSKSFAASAVRSDPNDFREPRKESHYRFCIRRVPSPQEAPQKAVGLRHVNPTPLPEPRPRGVRTTGNVAVESSAQLRPRGKRVDFSAPSARKESVCYGVKKFQTEVSPCGVPTTPHRSMFLVGTTCFRSLTPRQQRTPFAIDD